MAEFDRIQAIQTLVSDCETHRKAVVQLRVAGTTETLTITCPSLEVAESLADLIDGYCRLASQSTTSLWNRKGEIIAFSYSCIKTRVWDIARYGVVAMVLVTI